ncbi:MAG: CHAT domain-containing tetratricopeptide repeat protein [Erythrobacter sp.]|jgi:CHAT domain-containing protein|nr:CHAT domain-containing tetratricopeptide repeat protein [Erythrobacter sp.]
MVDGMRGAIAAMALAAGLGALPLAAKGAEREYADPEVEIDRLIERAAEVFNTTTPDAEGAAAIIAAWEEVQVAARRVSPDHLAIARADIPIASQLYNLGRNAEARAAVERGLAGLPDGDPDTLVVRAEGVALLGTLLAQAGEADAAVAALEEGYRGYMESFAELAPESIGRSEAVSKSNLEFSLSQVMLQLSRIPEALEYQRASLATREEHLGPNDPDTVGSIYGLAGTLRRAGRMEEAEAQARIAVERALAHVDPSHPSHARALEMLAIILSRSGRPVEANDYLARSLELKREHEGADSLFFGYGIHLLATILHQRERYAEAVPLFEEAAPIFAKYQGEGSPFGLGSQGYAAQGTFALGREAEALELLRAVDARMEAGTVDTEIAKRIGPDLVRALVRAGEVEEAARVAGRDRARLLETEGEDAFALRHALLVDAYAQSALAGDRGGAAQDARDMLEFLERDRVRDLSGAWQAEQRAALDLVMEIALAGGHADLMVQAIALAAGSGIAQASALRAERLAAGGGELGAALKALQQAEAELDAADRDLLRAYAGGTGLEGARTRLETAAAARSAAFAALKGRDAALDSLLDPGRTSIDAIRADLGEGEALLALAPAYDGAYSLLVTQESLLMNRIALSRAELVALAATVRDGAANADFDADVSARLAEAILPPEARAALAGADRLRILAGGALASLPFGVLVLEGEGATPRFLADRFALAQVASFERPAQPGRGAAGGFVAFAAPTPFESASASSAAAVLSPATYFDRGGAASTRLAGLPPLPGSEREARFVARAFPEGETRLFLGAEASEARLADPVVARAEILLFATHGLVGGELEGIAEPALILSPEETSDGVLTASEIARLDLAADWVLLSACDSAAGFEGGVPAFSGLVAAFRFAGAGSLLATHWKVRDDVAAFVAVRTIDAYRRGGDKARALAEAVRALRRESGLPDADQPHVWGPFVLID